MVRKSRSDASSSTMSRSKGILLRDYTSQHPFTFDEQDHIAQTPLVEVFARHFVEHALDTGAITSSNQGRCGDAARLERFDERHRRRTAHQTLRQRNAAID